MQIEFSSQNFSSAEHIFLHECIGKIKSFLHRVENFVVIIKIKWKKCYYSSSLSILIKQ